MNGILFTKDSVCGSILYCASKKLWVHSLLCLQVIIEKAAFRKICIHCLQPVYTRLQVGTITDLIITDTTLHSLHWVQRETRRVDVLKRLYTSLISYLLKDTNRHTPNFFFFSANIHV